MKEYNLTSVIRFVEVVLALVVALNAAVAIYTILKLDSNALETIKMQFEEEVDKIDLALETIHDTMRTELVYNRDFDQLQVAKPGASTVDQIVITNRFKTMIQNWSRDLPYSIRYVIYYPHNEIIIHDSATNFEYEQWRLVKSDVLSLIDNNAYGFDWQITSLADENYLIDVLSVNGHYFVAFASVNDLMRSLRSEAYGENHYFVLSDSSGNVFYNQDLYSGDSYDSPVDTGRSVLRDPLRGVLKLVKETDNQFFFSLVIHNYNQLFKPLQFQLMIGIILIVVVTLALFVLRFVNKSVLQPIRDFTKSVETLKNDEIYDVKTHYRLNELGNASTLISDMVRKIKDLKIDIYEKTLEQQKTEMDFLSLQIEPHFYLNCLTIMHNMAQFKQYDEIQMMSRTVSDYMRYVLKIRESRTTIGEEIDHIKKYLQIQKIRYGEWFDAVINVADSIQSIEIPPLIIHTFVENALKHTIDWEQKIILEINGVENDGQIEINIEDNGEGFDSDILKKLQQDVDISEGEKRIGIVNSVARMHMFYGSSGYINFYNRDNGGAGIKIVFPAEVNQSESQLM
jgi:sensor histidine kinase YesM